jgi:hypothetical protein
LRVISNWACHLWAVDFGKPAAGIQWADTAADEAADGQRLESALGLDIDVLMRKKQSVWELSSVVECSSSFTSRRSQWSLSLVWGTLKIVGYD